MCVGTMQLVLGRSHSRWFCAGQLVLRRFRQLPSPSHHAIRTACIQILPVVEMYCRYMLQEDCANLRSLMLRFDDEQELQSHDLGRSLLYMIRDDDSGLDMLSRRSHASAPHNPFEAVRARIAAVDLALVGLRPVVQVAPALCAAYNLWDFILMPFRATLQFAGFHLHSLQCVCPASLCLAVSSPMCRGSLHFWPLHPVLSPVFAVLCKVCRG